MTLDIRETLRRARIHLTLLEQDAGYPLEFLNHASPTAPPLILRADMTLHTAHSDVGLSHGQLRDLLIRTLQRRIDELTAIISDNDPHFRIDQLQYGDQTEA